ISDNTHVAITSPSERRGLIHRFQEWSALHSKQKQLWQAKGQAEADAAKFSAAHNALDARIDAQSGGSAPAASPSANSPGSASPNDDSGSRLQLTKRRSQDQK